MNRTLGTILTVVTTLLCACPGFGLCLFGALTAAGRPMRTALGGAKFLRGIPPIGGVGLICLALVLIAIPVVLGFFTFRAKK